MSCFWGGLQKWLQLGTTNPHTNLSFAPAWKRQAFCLVAAFGSGSSVATEENRFWYRTVKWLQHPLGRNPCWKGTVRHNAILDGAKRCEIHNCTKNLSELVTMAGVALPVQSWVARWHSWLAEATDEFTTCRTSTLDLAPYGDNQVHPTLELLEPGILARNPHNSGQPTLEPSINITSQC